MMFEFLQRFEGTLNRIVTLFLLAVTLVVIYCLITVVSHVVSQFGDVLVIALWAIFWVVSWIAFAVCLDDESNPWFLYGLFFGPVCWLSLLAKCVWSGRSVNDKTFAKKPIPFFDNSGLVGSIESDQDEN
jgi:hypothetical protein